MVNNSSAYKQGILSESTSKLQLTNHVSRVAEKIMTKHSISNNSSDKLQDFCQSKTSQSKIEISLFTITDMHNALKHWKQSSTHGLDGLDTNILKLDAPLITDTFAYATSYAQ